MATVSAVAEENDDGAIFAHPSLSKVTRSAVADVAG